MMVVVSMGNTWRNAIIFPKWDQTMSSPWRQSKEKEKDYNPSYSGGRDQEDRGLKSAGANGSRDPISKKKKKSQKRAGGVPQGVGSEFRPQYCKIKINK
jgi:hypothetical protein